MVFYIDCSTLPLRGAMATPWFDAGAMAGGENVSDAEKQVFAARFAVDASDLPRMRELAEDARGARHVRRLQTAATLRGAPGVDEDEAGGGVLFFPLPAAKIDKLHDVDVLRDADGVVARLAESVKTLPSTVHDLRSPLPTLFAPGEWWGTSYTDGMMVKQMSNAVLGLVKRDKPFGAINPAVFGRPAPLTPTVHLSFSMLEALLQPSTVSIPGGAPASALRTPLLAHVGSEAVDAHADLLGEMQQAQFGWERYATDRTIRGIQQRANVVLLYLETRSPWASALTKPMTIDGKVAKLVDMLKRLKVDTIAVSDREAELVKATGDRDVVRNALALLLVLEANAPWWRRQLVGADDALCFFALMFLLRAYFDNEHILVGDNLSYPWPADEWKAYRASLASRYDALTASFNEQVVRARAMVARYEVDAEDEVPLLALIAKRRLLRFALLDTLRVQQQREALRDNAAYVRQVNSRYEFFITTMPLSVGSRDLLSQLNGRTSILGSPSPYASMLAAQYKGQEVADAAAKDVLADATLVRSLLTPVSDSLSI